MTKKYALVVGINGSSTMEILPKLQYAESDAKGINYLLSRKECEFISSSHVLTGYEANTANIRKALFHLIEGKSKEELLLFYFIGHGYPVQMIDGTFEVFLVTTDFNLNQARINKNSYITLNEIQQTLYQNYNTADVISILDCCHAGHILAAPPFARQLTQLLDDFLRLINNTKSVNLADNRTCVVLASTGQNAEAFEYKGHALMSGLIIKALGGHALDALEVGSGNLTLASLFSYLARDMQKLAFGVQQARISGPQVKNWILAHHPSANPVQRKPEDYPKSPLTQMFDMETSPATFIDLDSDQVRMFLDQGRVTIQQDYQSGPDEQSQMQALGLLQDEHPNYATLLCFGNNPSRRIPGAYTRCVHYPNPDMRRVNTLDDDPYYRGGLLQQFTQALAFLRKHLRKPDESSVDLEIPLQVLQEALANALVHREYVTEPNHVARTEGVKVEIFNDRVEITSPGGPPLPLDGHSHPRNPQIMRIFYLSKHVEELGKGIKRMEDLMQREDLQHPRIIPGKETFTIVLYRPVQLSTPQSQTDPNMSSTESFTEINSTKTGKEPIIFPPVEPKDPTQDPPDVPPIDPSKGVTHSPISRKRQQLLVTAVSLVVSIMMIFATGEVLGAMGYHISFTKPSSASTPHTVPVSTTIKIASDFPTSGLDTTDGLPLQNGVQMAINEANNEHNLPRGYTLEPFSKSDVGRNNRHDPQVGADNLKGFIADNLVAGVIGPYNSSVALEELPLTNHAPLAQLSPSTTFPCLTKSVADDPACAGINDVAGRMRSSKQPTFFRLATTDDLQGKTTADYFFKTNGYRKVLLLKDGSDAYSAGLAQAFQIEWQSLGGPVTSIDLPQSTTNTPDYQKTLQAVASTQPNLIYFAGGSPNGSYVLQALSKIEELKTVPFAGGDGIMKSNLLASLQRDAHAPIYASLPIADPTHTPMGANFESDYLANNFQNYRPYVAAAYDCTKLLIQAIKQTLQHTSTPHGTQDQAGAVQFRQAVLQALRHLPPYTGATGTHTFDANGDTTNHTISFYQANLSTSPLRWTWLQQINAS